MITAHMHALESSDVTRNMFTTVALRTKKLLLWLT